jgi:1-acyl-sn-glycerol-3-phosphate acyltransferase
MTSAWHRILARTLARLAFHRITVLHPERLPQRGPTLYVGLHRNGAVDGFVYSSVLPRASFLISTQLRKRLLGRIFFSGIEVVRDKDQGDRKVNDAALTRCREYLQSGGELFIFPEGTSSLGPRHLPFKSGAARLALDAIENGVDLTIVPLGIAYEAPDEFRSNVEVIVGEPVSTRFEEGDDRLSELKRRLTRSLEDVGINVDSREVQEKIEKLAYASTLGTSRSYHESLKSLETSIPPSLDARWRSLQREMEHRPFTHQGVPLVPLRNGWLYALVLAVLSPFVLAGAALNVVPLLGATLASRRLADGRNVVMLWKILAGVPLLVVWALAIAAASIAAGQPLLVAGYALVTLTAIALTYRVKKLGVAVGNWLFHRGARAPLLDLYRTLLEGLPDEPR